MGFFSLKKIRVASGVLAVAVLSSQALAVPTNDGTVPAASSSAPSAAGAAADGNRKGQSADKIALLIEQLGDPQYLVRQAAQEQLLRMGPQVFDALIAAESSEDVEIATRAKYLLQLIPIDRDFDSPQVKRILQGYTLADDAGRLAKIKQLANLLQDAGVPALCRLVRYEKSQVLSKQAALHLLGHSKETAEEHASRLALIGPALEGSGRPGARWLQVDVRADRPSDSATSDWDKLIDDEIATLRSAPGDTSSQIVLALLRRQADSLMKLNEREHALQTMRKMIGVEKAETLPLAQLTDWFIKQQAPELVEEAAERFQAAFHSSPVLLYFLAEASVLQGKKEQADKLAREAEQLTPQNDQAARSRIAAVLRQRGLFDWSEREYHRVIDLAPNDAEAIFARVSCAEMLHDLDRDNEAAEMLQKGVDAISRNKLVVPQNQQNSRIETASIRSWLHYYSACYCQKQQNVDQQWAQLEKSIALDPTNEDVLIAMYRASANDPARRTQAMNLIRKTAAQLLSQVSASAGQGEEAMMCNQYAWLIGNTEGDYDEAIQLSHRSIDLVLEQYRAIEPELDLSSWGGSPDREPAGYIDTLAHCYAGKGDYENALKYQTRAAELEPHTMAITRAVDEFKAKLAESRKQKQ